MTHGTQSSDLFLKGVCDSVCSVASCTSGKLEGETGEGQRHGTVNCVCLKEKKRCNLQKRNKRVHWRAEMCIHRSRGQLWYFGTKYALIYNTPETNR
jgi:hypothetical protein